MTRNLLKKWLLKKYIILNIQYWYFYSLTRAIWADNSSKLLERSNNLFSTIWLKIFDFNLLKAPLTHYANCTFILQKLTDAWCLNAISTMAVFECQFKQQHFLHELSDWNLTSEFRHQERLSTFLEWLFHKNLSLW